MIKQEVKRIVELVVRAGLRVLPDRLVVIMKSQADLVRPLDYESERLLLHVDSEIEYRVRLRSCAKEPETIRWIETNLREGDVFYDIGANVGAYSLVAAAVGGANARILAFEAGATTFSQLCRNLAVNPVATTISAFPVALTEKTHLVTFHYSALAPGAALHSVDNSMNEKHDSSAFSQVVLGYRLDDFRKQFDLPAPSMVKLDVDGGEVNVLRGACETFTDRSLRTALIEIEEETESGEIIKELMYGWGFGLSARYRCVPGATGRLANYHNCVFHRA